MSAPTEPAAGNPGGWTDEQLARIPEYKARVVEGLREGLFLSEIADAMDLRARLIRHWRSADREFDLACMDAEEAHIDQIDKEAIRRAKDGVLEPVINRGQLVMDPRDPGQPLYVRKYSDSLMQFVLRGRRREVYGEHREVDANVRMNVQGARDELARRLSQIDESEQEAGVSADTD